MPPDSEKPNIDPRFFVAKSKVLTYEFSADANRLGESFVADACAVVRDHKIQANVTERTWLDNYVARLRNLFSCLAEYLGEMPEPKDPLAFTEANWHEFGEWLTAHIRNELIAKRTQDKKIFCSNKLLNILTNSGVIPVRIELVVQSDTTRAKSSATITARQKGGPRKPKLDTHLSPFAFRIEEHQRAYDYSEFQPLARRFLLLAKPHINIYYRQFSKGYAKTIHNTFSNLLRFLAKTKEGSLHPKFFEALSSEKFENIPSISWETMISQWRESLARPDASTQLLASHRHTKILTNLWKHFVAAQLLPEISIAGFKNAKRKGSSQPRRSLAQLTQDSADESEVAKATWERVKKFFDDAEQTETHEFIRSLSAKLSPEKLRTLSIDDFIEEIHALNKERLQDLRNCAELDFLKWHQHWQKGQEYLVAAGQSPEELIHLLDSPNLTASEKRRNSSGLLAYKDPERVSVGNCLQYIESTQNGVITSVRGRYHHIARVLRTTLI